jgi:pantoate--beta-alanine ligase
VGGTLKVVRTVAEVRSRVADAKAANRSIGLVPTMGALHQGHASLVEAARKRSGYVVVSLFVNPFQFGPNEDLAKYPRSEEADRDLCEQAGADLLFAPTNEEMYPDGRLGTHVEPPAELAGILDGASRPGHFRGVATVVLKLFQITSADLAWFGEKDFQQLQVIRRMVRDLDLPIEIVPAPIVRAPDGLALSSRNGYLNADQRRAAVVLSQALDAAQRLVAAGETSADRVRQEMQRTVQSEGLARLDYATVVDAERLTPLETIEPGQAHEARALLAAWVGPARLIDNAPLG